MACRMSLSPISILVRITDSSMCKNTTLDVYWHLEVHGDRACAISASELLDLLTLGWRRRKRSGWPAGPWFDTSDLVELTTTHPHVAVSVRSKYSSADNVSIVDCLSLNCSDVRRHVDPNSVLHD